MCYYYLAGEENMADNTMSGGYNNTIGMNPQGGTPIQPAGANPLAKHFRQAKIYLRLPSGGKWWPEGSIDMPENGELPVYSMTAKDELVLKTPDALINGQATATLMQSCIPNIKNAFHCPSIDLDAILIAIRIATYGETMAITSKVPNTEIEKDFDINLVQLLDTIVERKFPETFTTEGFTFKLRPISYKTFTEMSIKSMEQSRVVASIQDSKMTDSEKMSKFDASFKLLSEMNLNIVVDQVVYVQYGHDEPVTDPKHIKDFFANADSIIFERIKDHIEKVRSDFALPPFETETTVEEREAGAPLKFEVPITFDQSNFFARR